MMRKRRGRKMNKKLIMFLFVFISLGAVAEEEVLETVLSDKNPLKEMMTDQNFDEGMKRFIDVKSSMFDNKLTDAAEQRKKLESRFTDLILLVQKNGAWNGTFYYKDKDNKVRRNTVRGREIMRIDGDGYFVHALANGLRVTDLKTGTSILLEKRSRW
jgi:hypothetical protein